MEVINIKWETWEKNKDKIKCPFCQSKYDIKKEKKIYPYFSTHDNFTFKRIECHKCGCQYMVEIPNEERNIKTF